MLAPDILATLAHMSGNVISLEANCSMINDTKIIVAMFLQSICMST